MENRKWVSWLTEELCFVSDLEYLLSFFKYFHYTLTLYPIFRDSEFDSDTEVYLDRTLTMSTHKEPEQSPSLRSRYIFLYRHKSTGITVLVSELRDLTEGSSRICDSIKIYFIYLPIESGSTEGTCRKLRRV